MRIMNPGNMDCHTHSSNFSDGMSSVDEMVSAAVKFDIEELWITDHSEACYPDNSGAFRTPRIIADRWRPLHNGIQVRFGVECDLLNKKGDICDHIQGRSSEFLILSAHPERYSGKPKTITNAYVNAIRRHGSRIKFIGHPCAIYFGDYVEIERLVIVANEHNIPLELNCANLMGNRTNLAKLNYLLTHVNSIYVNSDAHTLQHLRDLRKQGFEFLKKEGYLD